MDGAPFQGILQGNGCGPVLWLAVSTQLIEMMQTRGHGITALLSADRRIERSQ